MCGKHIRQHQDRWMDDNSLWTDDQIMAWCFTVTSCDNLVPDEYKVTATVGSQNESH